MFVSGENITASTAICRGWGGGGDFFIYFTPIYIAHNVSSLLCTFNFCIRGAPPRVKNNVLVSRGTVADEAQ